MISLEIVLTDGSRFYTQHDGEGFKHRNENRELKPIEDAKIVEALQKPYSRIIVFLEDNVVSIGGSDNQVAIFDALTGKSYYANWNRDQILAAVQLALFGDEDRPELYEIAEPLFKDCPSECRFIP